MFFVPKIAVPHLITALKQELARLRKIAETDEDNWPEDFDGNDLPLFETALAALKYASEHQTEEVQISGKALVFMLFVVPGYVKANKSTLRAEEYQALKQVYDRHPGGKGFAGILD